MEGMANSSESPGGGGCASSVPARFIFTSWFSLYLLLLPVFLLVLYIGFNKWRRPQSAAGGLSHSDVFTLHMVLMETFCVSGSCVALSGYFTLDERLLKVGGSALSTTTSAQMLFHVLTCVERYLAVVHPVSYLRLRRGGGATLRNTCISVVWLITVGYSVLLFSVSEPMLIGALVFVVSAASLPLVAFCSIFVLCVLTRPKPGERGGLQKQVDQSKRSTIYTMSAILGALLLRMTVSVLICAVTLWFWSKVEGCAAATATFLPTLPSSLVLPLLFLHRAGKLSRA